MKNFLAALLVTGALYSGNVVAQIQTPQPSPSATVQQVVGITNFTINYSRPGAKGRTVFGDVVPFGKVWRTGANGATMLTIDDKIKLEGNEIPAGKYSIFTIPDKTEWTVIVSKDVSGSSSLAEGMDLVRFKVKTQALAMNVETFTIGLSNFTNTAASLDMMWEKTAISMKVETDPDVKISEQIKKAMTNPLGQAAQNYYQSASYYYENGKDLKQALEWIIKATEINKTAFWMVRMKSLIQAKLGDYKMAIESAEMSKKMSAEAKNDEWVKMNETSIAEWKKLVK
jgi:hypothetical protein